MEGEPKIENEIKDLTFNQEHRLKEWFAVYGDITLIKPDSGYLFSFDGYYFYNNRHFTDFILNYNKDDFEYMDEKECLERAVSFLEKWIKWHRGIVENLLSGNLTRNDLRLSSGLPINQNELNETESEFTTRQLNILCRAEDSVFLAKKLLKKLEPSTSKSNAKPIKKLSLRSNLNPTQTKQLYNGLKDYCLKNSEKQFEYIFSDELTVQSEPIKWLQTNELFAYFFDSLFTKEFINNKNWKSIIEKCNLFINAESKDLKASDISSAKKRYEERDENPQGYQTIDKIIDGLKQ